MPPKPYLSKDMEPDDIDLFFEKMATHTPHPETELHYTDPFALLVAVMLSAQATDKSVNRVTPGLFQEASTPEQMVQLGEERISTLIQSLGLYRTKAKNLFLTCHKLITSFGGNVPSTRDELVSLPGVGRKTANVILNVAFHQPTIPVDTHIFRVSCRTGLAPAPHVEGVEELLVERVPDRWKPNAHHWLVLHGRYTCQARKPQCQACVVHALCHYPFKTA